MYELSKEPSLQPDRRQSPLNQDEFSNIFNWLEDVCARAVPEGGFIDHNAITALLPALRQRFAADGDRVSSAAGVLFGDDISAYGLSCATLFNRWEAEGGLPGLPALVAQAAAHMALDLQSLPVRCAFLAAVLAELPNTLQYHGNEHYRKVLFHSIRLMVTHNRLFKGTPRELDKDDIATLLAASCIHDLGHQGGDNMRDAVYTPGYMEQQAIDAARPFFTAAGLSSDITGAIETLVFCTDITFFAGDNSPCVRMKKIYRHYFWEGYNEDVSLLMMGKLRRYEDNPKMALMAMLLHEADVGTSAGLSYEQTMKETINILEERGLKSAGPKVVLAFLRDQLGETMFTEAGKQIFGPVMAQVIVRAEQDMAQGRNSFYS